MLICRSSHPQYRSNAYAVVSDRSESDRPDAIIIDAGAPVEPLLAHLDSARVHAILITHLHHDHTEHAEAWSTKFDCPILGPNELLAGTGSHTFGGITVQALSTPGHIDVHASLLVNDTNLFTGDVLFRGSVGGTMGFGPDGYETIKKSLLEVLFSLDHALTVYPGHSEETTLAAEWNTNPFVRVMRGFTAEYEQDVAQVGSDPVTVLLESRDYDDGTKAIVEFESGARAIVGGGMLQRKVRS